MKNLKRVSKTLFLAYSMKHLNVFPFIVFLQPIKVSSGDQLYNIRCFLTKHNIAINRIKGSFLKLGISKLYKCKALVDLNIGSAFIISGTNAFLFLESLKVLGFINEFFIPFFFKVNNVIISQYAWSFFLSILKKSSGASIHFFFLFPFWFFIFSLNFFLNFILYKKMFSEFFFIK